MKAVIVFADKGEEFTDFISEDADRPERDPDRLFYDLCSWDKEIVYLLHDGRIKLEGILNVRRPVIHEVTDLRVAFLPRILKITDLKYWEKILEELNPLLISKGMEPINVDYIKVMMRLNS
jgi:hypothetical protein